MLFSARSEPTHEDPVSAFGKDSNLIMEPTEVGRMRLNPSTPKNRATDESIFSGCLVTSDKRLDIDTTTGANNLWCLLLAVADRDHAIAVDLTVEEKSPDRNHILIVNRPRQLIE